MKQSAMREAASDTDAFMSAQRKKIASADPRSVDEPQPQLNTGKPETVDGRFKPEEKKKSERLSVYLTQSEYQSIVALASMTGRSKAMVAHDLIAKSLRDEDSDAIRHQLDSMARYKE